MSAALHDGSHGLARPVDAQPHLDLFHRGQSRCRSVVECIIPRGGGALLSACAGATEDVFVRQRRSGRWSVSSGVHACQDPRPPRLRREMTNFIHFCGSSHVLAHCCAKSFVSSVQTKHVLHHDAERSPGEHSSQPSCLGSGFYRLSNIHLAGPQLCMKDWWQ